MAKCLADTLGIHILDTGALFRALALCALRKGCLLYTSNAQFLVEFMAKLGAELAGENEGIDHKVIDAFSPAG